MAVRKAKSKAGGQNRGNAETLRQYWTRGKGAAKIKWGLPGDFKRCTRQLNKYMPGRAEGYCNLRHKAATGMSTAQHAKLTGGRKGGKGRKLKK